MFETWEKVAVEYKNIDSVTVVQMDAHEAKKPGISIFPTVKYVKAQQLVIHLGYSRQVTITNTPSLTESSAKERN